MHTNEFERLRGVLADADEPLTAREILTLVEEQDAREDGDTFDSSHRVATVLGRWAEHGDVEVIADTPYRYRLNT